MTDKELKDALKRLGFVRTVNKRSPIKSIYDSKPLDVIKVSWNEIEGNVEDNKTLMNKLGTELSKVKGGSGTTVVSGNTYFPSNWI
jgi:hypothetical protein